jgi:hypothetical protein
MPVIGFHSTPAMNVITFFGVIALYGRSTRKRTGWMASKPSDRGSVAGVRKYRKHKFEIFPDSRMGVDMLQHDCRRSVECSLTERSLHDEGVQVFPFPQYAGTEPAVLLNSLETTFRWRLPSTGCFRKQRKRRCGYVVARKETLPLP